MLKEEQKERNPVCNGCLSYEICANTAQVIRLLDSLKVITTRNGHELLDLALTCKYKITEENENDFTKTLTDDKRIYLVKNI